MNASQIIAKWNPTAANELSSIGAAYDKNTDLYNTNTAGIIVTRQYLGGNAAAVVEVQGSIDGVQFSPIFTATHSTQTGLGGGGLGNDLCVMTSAVIPPYLRMKVTTLHHTTTPATSSGLGLYVIY